MKYKCYFCDRVSSEPYHYKNIDGENWATVESFMNEYLLRPHIYENYHGGGRK